MNILIRADASAQIGGGHVGRCIALAQEFSDRGCYVEFATRDYDDLGTSMLKRADMPFQTLSSDPDWRSDADATREAAGTFQWVVVDHYSLDARWQSELKNAGHKVLVIDDLANRPHDCDVLVDAGRAPDSIAYRDLVPGSCIVLLGPRYQILRREFLQDRRQVPGLMDGSARKNLLVFFGSADGAGLTIPVLEALDASGVRKFLDVHVVVTDANRQRREIERYEGVAVHTDVTDMAALLTKMDFAIGAAGVSMWERCRMGIPSLTVAVNDNQKSGLEVAAADGAVIPFSIENARSPDALRDIITGFVSKLDKLDTVSVAARQLVDGKGARRIASVSGPARLRVANQDDCELIWTWANDPLVRRMSFHSDPIPYEQHTEWFDARLKNSMAIIQVAEVDGKPAGQVRLEFSETEDGWVVDISVAPEFRGRGLALEIMQKAISALRRIHREARVVAWVKKANENSVRVFDAAGFRQSSENADAVRFVDDISGLSATRHQEAKNS